MTEKEIIDSIIKTYVQRLDELKDIKQRHFLYRAFVSTGRPELQELLRKKMSDMTRDQAERVIDKYNHNHEKFVAVQGVAASKYRAKKINDQKKKEQWEKHPLIFAYHTVLWPLYYVRKLELNLPLENPIKLAEVQAELLNNPDFTKYAVVSATNTVYVSRNLGLFDIEPQFVELFKKTFKSDEILADDVVFTNYIYGLTHIIIGDSEFYERGVDAQKYAWAKEQFVQYQDEIYKRLTLDINEEVALCLRFLGESNDNEFVQKVKKRLIKVFDVKEGYIQREIRSNFDFAEHTNAVALVLFNFDNLNFIQ